MMTTEMDRTATAISFEADEQTWKDIDLFDQGKVGTAFTFFNRVKTRGGEVALERMLKSPSNHRIVLEGRRDTIRFFRDERIDLQIGREQLRKIEHYLSSGVFLFPHLWSKAFLYSIRYQLKHTSAHLALNNGIRMTVSLLRYLFELRESWLAGDCPDVLAHELAGLPGLVADQRVRELVMGGSRRLRLIDLARCDRYFRGAGKPCLQHLLRLLYEWDVFEAIATVTQHYDWCFPQYDDSPEPFVRVEGLFPPWLTGTVSNDFNLGKGPNLCFITGANRAGKTTFLKSFGLAVYLAHVGFPVPARSFRATVFNGLLITIDLCDGMGQGYSHFYSEVRRLKDILGQIREKKRVLVIFDDLFLGTHVKETGGEVLQVIEGLAGIGGNLFLLSTPVVEIADGLQGNRNIAFSCFESETEGGVPWYSYRLREGVSRERTGTALLREEGVLDMLEQLQMKQAAARSEGRF